MPLPVGLDEVTTPDVDQTAKSIKSSLRSLILTLREWGGRLNGGAQFTSTEVEAMMQEIAAVRALVEANKATAGLGMAYARQFDGYAGSQLGSDWGPVKTALDNLFDALTATWPEKTANGRFAFVQQRVGTFEFESFNVSITSTQRTQITTAIDAVVATVR